MNVELVNKIINKHFPESHFTVTRMTTGICNEVYDVALGDRSVVLRIGVTSDNLLGSSKYIPLFREHGIKVPEILAEDYSRSTFPYPYQILSKLEGKDLIYVIHELSEDQLKAIAQDITTIIQKLSVIPTNEKFGWVGNDESKLVESLYVELERDLALATERVKETGIYDEQLHQAVMSLFDENREYFEQAKSTFYYDDLNGKNVMIHNGNFNGLVDLDGVKYGDPVQAVGAIRASWPETHYGDFYTEQVIRALQYSEPEKRIVNVYAIFHRYCWMSENGVQFNANTSSQVNMERLANDKRILNALLSRIGKV